MMSPGVIADAQQLKVFQSVVGLVAVSVVDVLIASKVSAKMICHDLTMFKDKFITDTNSGISV